MPPRNIGAPVWWPELAADFVVALGEMGPKAQKAVPTLILLVQNWEDTIKKLAIESLGKIGAGAIEALPALEEATRSPHESVRDTALTAMKRIQPGRPAFENGSMGTRRP